MNRKRVGILVFPQVEVLDFCGPFEVFSVTRLNESARREESSPFEVLLVAETVEPVSATGGLRVVPDVTIDACPPLDVLIVPGGWGTRREIKNERLLAWIKARGASVETLTSAGISAGIDMALRVVARYHGEEVARNTARHMEYRYVPEDNSRRI